MVTLQDPQAINQVRKDLLLELIKEFDASPPAGYAALMDTLVAKANEIKLKPHPRGNDL